MARALYYYGHDSIVLYIQASAPITNYQIPNTPQILLLLAYFASSKPSPVLTTPSHAYFAVSLSFLAAMALALIATVRS